MSNNNIVFIKPAEIKNATPVKILLPQTIPALKKSCQLALKEDEPIVSLTKPDGTPITNINQIATGATILASTKKIAPKTQAGLSNDMYQDIVAIPVLMGEAGSSVAERQQNAPRRAAPVAKSPSQTQVSDRFTVSGSMASIDRYAGMSSRATSRAQTVFNDAAMGKSVISRKHPASIKQTAYRAMLSILLPDAGNPFPTLDYEIQISEQNKLLTNAMQFDDNQRQVWYSAIMKQPIFQKLKKVKVYEEVVKIASGVVEDHRFVSGRVFDHRFKVGIVGPRLSGKSIFLGEISDQYICELASTGHWKSTYVFSLDMKEIVPIIEDYVQLLRYIVELTFDTLGEQHPGLLEQIEPSRKQLLLVANHRINKNPNQLTPVTDLAVQLSNSLYNEDGINSFYTNIFMLPQQIANIFGLTNLYFIIDHLELADVQIKPHDPFSSSGDYIFVIEYIKYALESVDFAVSCYDTSFFFQSMNPTDEKGVDLLAGLDIITTTDLAAVDEEDSTKFVLQMEGEMTPIPLTVDMCGGVVRFLDMWDELSELVSNLEAAQPQSQTYSDLLFQSIVHAQELIDLIFYTEDDGEMRVRHISKVV